MDFFHNISKILFNEFIYLLDNMFMLIGDNYYH